MKFNGKCLFSALNVMSQIQRDKSRHEMVAAPQIITVCALYHWAVL